MSENIEKVCIAMSGGVDSSVAALLLKQQHYSCRGVFMMTHDNCHGDMADAKRIAAAIGIEIDILDLREQFREILDYFCREYKRARTPNPCVYCNRVMKFGLLWRHAQEKGCNYIATGHYIRRIDDKIYVGSDMRKEQSYVLTMVEPDVIKHTIFPTGTYTKPQIREIAFANNLDIHEKPDSQEICFIPNDDYAACLESLSPEVVKKGDIVYIDGRKLGEHNGIHRYTIGQRRGLKVAMGEPVYVTSLDAATNTVTLGPQEAVMSKVCYTDNANWLTPPHAGAFEAIVKIRYNNVGTAAKVEQYGDGLRITFDSPVSAVTPGQVAAVYLEDANGRYLAGGGWISRTEPLNH